MKITLLSDESLRVEPYHGAMTIEAESPAQHYSPFHMLASGLGYCVWSVLASWAEQAKLDPERLAIEVSWEFADEPYRVGSYALRVIWPGLPEARIRAAERAAELCTVHATFTHPPSIAVSVEA